jgi:hypothetical protein
MIDENDCGAIGGIKIGRGTEVLGENLPQRHFVHHKSYMTRPGLEPRAAAVGSQRLTTWVWRGHITEDRMIGHVEDMVKSSHLEHPNWVEK